ncbi:MAG: hypothetical protein V4671_07515 [Armatimonadota bacterium]
MTDSASPDDSRRNAAQSITMIRHVAQSLGPEMVRLIAFLGGASLPLLLTDPAVQDVRSTRDVDVIIEVMTYGEYASLAEELRRRNFQEDMSPGAPICRWVVDETIVDVMPTDEKILGFSNRWYKPALRTAQDYSLSGDDGTTIRLVTPSYFLATKLEAYFHRGEGDLYASHDIEDIITLIDGRPELLDEIRHEAPEDVREFIAHFFQDLLRDPGFREAVEGHLPYDARNRLGIVLARIRQIA